ncbi:MAG: HAD-IB family hydrolase [Actinomycetaceae bacterium]|nr:HAD-IB family hydrolase [Actinomycetaceae bacterium]
MSKYRQVAAVFDLDKTIVATSSALAMHGPLRKAGFLSRSDALASTLVQLPYLLFGEAEDRNARMRAQLARISHGWNAESVREIVRAATSSSLHPLCYIDALDAIEMHRAAGHAIVIASASPAPLVDPLAAILGADFTLATQVEIVNGRLTGQLDDFNHGGVKAIAVERLAQQQGWDLSQCWAYSDSISDLPLLELVGRPVAVNPDRQLRKVAKERNWAIRSFTRTVRLRRYRIALPAVGLIGFILAGLAARHQLSRR